MNSTRIDLSQLVGTIVLVIPRQGQLRRTMAIMLLLFFSISSTHALALVTPGCMQCPPDCPMHAKKLGCHHGVGAAGTTAYDHWGKHLRHGIEVIKLSALTGEGLAAWFDWLESRINAARG
jgi:hypothetical protein